MDKLQKLVSDFLSEKFKEWKPFLTVEEQEAFIAYYFKGMTTLQISFEMNYSQRNIQKLLRKARRKIYKILP